MWRGFLVKMLLSFGFLLIFSTRFVDVTIGERLSEYPLETAWKATGLPLGEVCTEAWMKLNDRRLCLYELKEMARQLQKKLDLRLKTGITGGEQDEFSYVSFEGTQTNGASVTVTIQSTRTEEVSETQLGVNTVHNGEITNLRRYIQGLKEKLTSLGSGLDFNVIFMGERQGKIESSLVRELSGRAFRKIKADLVYSAFQEEQCEQKGFTNLISDSVKIDTRPVNIEFSAKYDRARNMTQIIMATPRATDGV